MASPALANWQPALCNLPGHSPFSYIQNDDDAARLNLINPSYGSAGMSVFSDPIDPAKVSSAPVVYAPLTLSGVVIGFNFDTSPGIDQEGNPIAQELALSGDRVQHLYLTPLLVARSAHRVVSGATAGRGWRLLFEVRLGSEQPPQHLHRSELPRVQPRFSQMSPIYGIDAGTLLVEEGSSDATEALWKWVLSDPEARAWLNGTPDAGDAGMNVNPYYSTNAAINPAGVALGRRHRRTIRRAIRIRKTLGWTSMARRKPPPARSVFSTGRRMSRIWPTGAADAADANDGAKTTFNPVEPPDLAWTANGPQETGNTFVMSVTTSPSAAQYGLQTASLSAAGDDYRPDLRGA